MTLEDFERSLTKTDNAGNHRKASENSDESRKRSKHHHRHHHNDAKDERRHKRRRYSRSHGSHAHEERHKYEARRVQSVNKEAWAEQDAALISVNGETKNTSAQAELTRDSWMEAPSTSEIDYTQKGYKKPPKTTISNSPKADFKLKIHGNELNKHHLQKIADGVDILDEITNESTQQEVDYKFGDAGSQWRMTKLKAVFNQANETKRSVEDIATERFGDLRAFDEAREEQVELERRSTYGEGYVGKDKPSGDLFHERKVKAGVQSVQSSSYQDENAHVEEFPTAMQRKLSPNTNVSMDRTALNRLKAQMLKAKLLGSPDAVALEADYDRALISFSSRKENEIVVLGAMEDRMLAGGRRGQVKTVDNKRGRERGLVEENEDMSIEDMVREERQTRNQAGGDGQRFAERIAKDGKFDNGLEYLDDNAAKLAKRVQKSEINLKNIAISEFEKMNRILNNCPLCSQEDTNTPPIAPVVSLATRVFLTLPTEPEISEGGACIIPIQHRSNLLECDDDEWEEIRNFMKSLTRMYHDQGRNVVFYENAAVPQRKKHAAMEAVPLPCSLGETAPAFFKEAILVADEEWTQHKKIIDTLAKAKAGLGKLAFRKTLVKEMPYFHVWFEIDGGLGHIVEDANRWPKGDLFAREIIGGMLDIEPNVIKKQGRWSKGGDKRTEGFRKRWRKFDWTTVLAGALS